MGGERKLQQGDSGEGVTAEAHGRGADPFCVTAETISAVLRRQAEQLGDATAMEFGQRVTSFAELDANSTLAAHALRRMGASPGGRIGYLGKNSDRYFELLFAASKAGLVMVPLGWRLTAAEIEFLIDDSEIELLFVEPGFVHTAESVASTRTLKLVSSEDAVGEVPGYESWRNGGGASTDRLEEPDPSAAIVQLYTSGTTGRPKGALLSHASIFALRPLFDEAGLDWERWEPGEVSVVTMPVAHISGTGLGLIGVYVGAKSIILAEFDAGVILRAISTEPVSRIFLVPTAIQALLRHPDVPRSDFSRLRYILYGASPMPLGILKEAMEVIGCEFAQYYGLTETCGSITVLPPEDHVVTGHNRMRSAGRAFPGVSIRIVDENLEPVPTGTVGEILLRSPTTMIGYWKRPDATREAFAGDWFRTGDAGYLDEDGYLFVQDRLKDMIISGGENVYPAEVESVLQAHPAIEAVAIFGIPDERWGEAVTAAVVRADPAADEAQILAWARERLASYKVPKRILFVDSLPLNASGKVLRLVLREPFWAGRDRAVN